jgi:hypothetical protein
MARGLESKLEKLERGSGDGNAAPFYILWVQAGADRDAALAALRASGKIGADVPAYCAEWKPSEDWVHRGRVFGPMARSRLTNHERLSDDEVKMLDSNIEADTKRHGIESYDGRHDPDPVREAQRRRASEMSDRELIGALLAGGFNASQCPG